MAAIIIHRQPPLPSHEVSSASAHQFTGVDRSGTRRSRLQYHVCFALSMTTSKSVTLHLAIGHCPPSSPTPHPHVPSSYHSERLQLPRCHVHKPMAAGRPRRPCPHRLPLPSSGLPQVTAIRPPSSDQTLCRMGSFGCPRRALQIRRFRNHRYGQNLWAHD